MKDFLPRVGTFFILMGIGLFVLFIASDANISANPGGYASFELLCASVSLLTVGILFRRAGTPPPSAERFRAIRKIRERREAARKEKARPNNAQEQEQKKFP